MKIIIPKNIPFRILGEIGVNYLRRNSATRQESALHLQETLLSYISHDCVDVIDKYRNISIDNEFKQKKIDRIIWVLWWQGDVDSNPIVSVCINKLYKIKGFDVRLLTKDNVRDYIFIDDMIELYNKGKLYIQHLADMIRIRLLRKYGGFWLDASIAVIDDSYFDWIAGHFVFFSNRLSDFDSSKNVSCGKYSTYFWGTFKDNPFFSFVDEMMSSFILRHEGVLDYTQFDYSIMAGYRNIGFIRDLIDSIPENNQEMWWLGPRLLEPFDKNTWDMITADTHLFKLSAKRYATLDFSFLTGSYWDYIVNTLWK